MSISLTKGQKISLTKADGSALTRVFMGLGWDPETSRGLFGKAKGKSIDLDASCIMLDESRSVVDAVWFRQLRSHDGSIQHSGDNLTGDGDGDDEVIAVDLTRVPASVHTLVFTVNSYSRQGFSDVANASCRLVDETTNQEVATYDLSAKGPHTGMTMAKLYRNGAEWKLAAIGETGQGQTWRDMLPDVLRAL